MDRRSWLWRRKSSETESSGSVSSYSERFYEEQEGLRVSSVNASPNSTQSPETSSKLTVYDPNETIRSLNEKLSAALLSINAKEELVQQHVKVAEEAVTGWEKAETDVAALKKQLELVLQKNSALEDRAKQLDAALKECVRQRRQSREEQEQIFRDALTKKTKEWENEKLDLETQIIELQAKLEVKAETASSIIDHQMCLKLEELEQEKSSLQIVLLAKTEDIHLRTLERDLSTQAAETASKQYLESIRKLAKLEAECRKLRAANRKSSPLNTVVSSACVESIENKAIERNLNAATVETNLMDDFLEMERLAALPEACHESSSRKIDCDSNLLVTTDGPSTVEVEVLRRESAELNQKIVMFEAEKTEMKMALSETRNQLKVTCDEMKMADNRLIELQRELSAANGSKHIFDAQMEEVDAKRKELDSQLKSAQLEISKLNEESISLLEGNFELQTKVQTLEGKLKEEETLSAKLAANMEDEEANRKKLSAELESVNMESVKLKERIRLLEEEVKHLQSQLSSADFEVRQLHEKLSSLERIIDEERASLTEFKAEAEAIMVAKKIEVEDLYKKANLLERKVEEERTISEGLAANREEMESQLESAHLEVQRLQDMVSSLRREVDEEKSRFVQMSIKKQEEKVMSRKERDFVMSSEMFVACQKTIDSISEQLKSISNFENLMIESEGAGCHLLQY